MKDARRNGWVQVITPTDLPLIQLLQRDLDKGEAEVIALAVEKKAALIFLDEMEARRIADLYGLNKTGIIGILMKAKQENLIDSLRDELKSLRENAGFWIEDGLFLKALRSVGEVEP